LASDDEYPANEVDMSIVQAQSVEGLVRELLKQPESATLEFKRYTIDQSVAAKILASFANSQGGYLIVGVDEHVGVVGCDLKGLRRVIDEALQKINPPAQVSMHEVQIDGKGVALVRVEPSSELVMAEAGAFIRVGEVTRPMLAEQILQRYRTSRPPENPDVLAEAISRQTVLIETLRITIEKSSGWKAKAQDYLVGGVIGAVLGVIATKIFGG
jgi:hypothetical protein